MLDSVRSCVIFDFCLEAFDLINDDGDLISEHGLSPDIYRLRYILPTLQIISMKQVCGVTVSSMSVLAALRHYDKSATAAFDVQ